MRVFPYPELCAAVDRWGPAGAVWVTFLLEGAWAAVRVLWHYLVLAARRRLTRGCMDLEVEQLAVSVYQNVPLGGDLLKALIVARCVACLVSPSRLRARVQTRAVELVHYRWNFAHRRSA